MANVNGELIKNKRKEYKMTQKELGKKCGVSSVYIHQLECDLKDNPSAELILKISTILDIPVKELSPDLDTTLAETVAEYPLKKLGYLLQYYREKTNFTQESLGELCGVSKSMIQKIELGRRAPSDSLLTKITDALGITVGKVFLDKDTINYVAQSAANCVNTEETKVLSKDLKRLCELYNYDTTDKHIEIPSTLLKELIATRKVYNKLVSVIDTDIIKRGLLNK